MHMHICICIYIYTPPYRSSRSLSLSLRLSLSLLFSRTLFLCLSLSLLSFFFSFLVFFCFLFPLPLLLPFTLTYILKRQNSPGVPHFYAISSVFWSRMRQQKNPSNGEGWREEALLFFCFPLFLSFRPSLSPSLSSPPLWHTKGTNKMDEEDRDMASITPTLVSLSSSALA